MNIKLWENEMPMYDENIDSPNSMTAYFVPTSMFEKLPAIVILPGGGYGGRASKHEGEEIAKFYQSNGIHAFVVDYRLHPYKFPVPLMDAQRAIKILKKNADKYNIDENKIFVIGFSAGGHLASCVATMEDYAKIGDEYDSISPSVAGAILSYAVTSAIPEDGSVTECVAKLTDESREELERLTTYKRVTENTPPCFIWHTSEDNVVPMTHSLMFADALHEKNIPVEMHIFPKGPHGVGLAKNRRDVSMWAPLTVEWIQNNF